jgi:hypothetical protein
VFVKTDPAFRVLRIYTGDDSTGVEVNEMVNSDATSTRDTETSE